MQEAREGRAACRVTGGAAQGRQRGACRKGSPRVKSIHRLLPFQFRPAGDGLGSPLQDSRAPLVAQLVENPPAVWESQVRSLGWEDPLETGKAGHSSILAWRIPRTG